MKKNLLFAFIAFTFIASCTKISNTDIGTGLIPAIDGVESTETTVDVTTFNLGLDSIRISKYQEMVVGNIDNDPLMGKTQAIINAEFKPNYYPYYFEVSNKLDSLKLDSAVLVLSYKGLWGDTAKPVKLKVFEISQTSFLKTDSVFSNRTKMNIVGQIGGVTINEPRLLRDSVFPFQEQAANQIRIPLTTAFGNKLLKEYDSSNVYKSDAQFSTTFHGFSIVPETGSNTLLRVSLSDTNSKVALYYKYTKRDGTGDSAVVRYFRPGAAAGASNNITRTRAGSEANTYLTNPATTPDSLLYLQAGPGNYVRIKTPGLKNITNRVIHRAELIMEQAADNDSIYTAPNLFLCAVQNNDSPQAKDSAYRFYVPYDVSLGQGGSVSNLSTFGGYINYKINSNGRRVATYSFDISRYVQSIITRGENVYDLYLFSPVEDYVYSGNGSSSVYPIFSSAFNSPACGRVRLFGGNKGNGDSRMRIRIIYSKL